MLNTPRAAVRPHPGSAFALDHDRYEQQIVEHSDGSCSVDAAVVGELLAHEILTGTRHPMLEPFRLSRFTAATGVH